LILKSEVVDGKYASLEEKKNDEICDPPAETEVFSPQLKFLSFVINLLQDRYVSRNCAINRGMKEWHQILFLNTFYIT
jgi:hypothetical protein